MVLRKLGGEGVRTLLVEGKLVEGRGKRRCAEDPAREPSPRLDRTQGLGSYGPRKSQAWHSAGSEPSASQADPRKQRPQEATLNSSDPKEVTVGHVGVSREAGICGVRG